MTQEIKMLGKKNVGTRMSARMRKSKPFWHTVCITFLPIKISNYIYNNGNLNVYAADNFSADQ